MSFSRRALLKASAASAVLGGIGAPFVAHAQQAEFTYKYANNLPDAHPMNARAKEMAAAIKAETNGRFDLQIFPNNQLGSDTDMLSQIRSGGVEFFTLSGLILATLVPAASISGIGFAFPNYDTVWKAMDGELGAYIRGEISQSQSRRDGQDLGQRLSGNDVIHQADQWSGRPQGFQDPRAGFAALDLDVQGL